MNRDIKVLKAGIQFFAVQNKLHKNSLKLPPAGKAELGRPNANCWGEGTKLCLVQSAEAQIFGLCSDKW